MMMTTIRHAMLVTLVALVAAGCGDTNIYPDNPTAPTPTPLPTAPTRHTVQFRVTGNAVSAVIRIENPLDGASQVVTALPYTVDVPSALTVMFLSLDVTPTAFPFGATAPFLSAQILIDGMVFREAVSTSTTLNTISVSGTWRAN
jgi:hypothetical protein